MHQKFASHWVSIHVWGDRVVWGDHMIWGDSTVWSIANRVIGGDRVLWGDTLMGYYNGNHVIWGDSSGLSMVDSQRVVWGDVSQSTLGSLSAIEDPFGIDTLDESAPAPRQHNKHTREAAYKSSREKGTKGNRHLVAGGDR